MGFDVRWCLHNLPYTGQSFVSNLIHKLQNILAHNNTSGNSGLPRLNSSRKSSGIPLPTQSPIWVNPMGPITQQEMLSMWQPQVTTCKLATQDVLSLNACSYHTGSGHCIRDISLIWLINMISTQCRPVYMSAKLVLSRVHVPPARSGQHDAVRCAVWHVNKPAAVAAV